MKNARITNLSTRYLGLYKNGVLVALLVLLGGLVYLSLFSKTGFFSVLALGFVIYHYLKMNRKVFHVEFDDEYLYLMRKEADILIPLQNIKDVELKTIGGLYEIELYSPEIVGNLIYYKPSLLYPFNFKAKDAVAEVLRNRIEKAKRRREIFPSNSLMS